MTDYTIQNVGDSPGVSPHPSPARERGCHHVGTCIKDDKRELKNCKCLTCNFNTMNYKKLFLLMSLCYCVRSNMQIRYNQEDPPFLSCVNGLQREVSNAVWYQNENQVSSFEGVRISGGRVTFVSTPLPRHESVWECKSNRTRSKPFKFFGM